MSTEMTLSIIKPDAVRRNLIGKIIQRFEDNDLSVVACKLIHLSKERAAQFYAEHKDRPFYNQLIAYMTSSPVLVQVIRGSNAIMRNREIMGDTDPSKAAAGTIRADFAESIEANSVHGSDSVEAAKREIAFFFSTEELCERD